MQCTRIFPLAIICAAAMLLATVPASAQVGDASGVIAGLAKAQAELRNIETGLRDADGRIAREASRVASVPADPANKEEQVKAINTLKSASIAMDAVDADLDKFDAQLARTRSALRQLAAEAADIGARALAVAAERALSRADAMDLRLYDAGKAVDVLRISIDTAMAAVQG